MKFSELLGDEQPTELPSGPNGRPPDVPALVDEVAAAPPAPAPAAPPAPAPADPFDAALDSQLDALPGPEPVAIVPEAPPETTPVRFSEPEPYQPEPEPYQPEPEPSQPEPVAELAPAAQYEPLADLEPIAAYEAPEPEAFAPAVEPVDDFASVARPTATSVFGGGRVEAQSAGLTPLTGSDAEEDETDDAMRIARLDVIDDDILPTTRKRSKK